MPKRIHPRRAANPFLLSGLAYCGYCGKALVARYAKSGKFSYYFCGTLDKKGAGLASVCSPYRVKTALAVFPPDEGAGMYLIG